MKTKSASKYGNTHDRVILIRKKKQYEFDGVAVEWQNFMDIICDKIKESTCITKY